MDKSQDILGQDYPDLSDDNDNNEDQQLHLGRMEKKVKLQSSTLGGKSITKPSGTIFMPTCMGGKLFTPPPPEKNSSLNRDSNDSTVRGSNNNNSQTNINRHNQINGYKNKQIINRNTTNNGIQHLSNMNYERKNCLYVKNIPKHFNVAGKLMTFFRNQGSIKEVKINEENHSAMVRFFRQENAIKFASSDKSIFNRSYIIYSLSEKQTVSVRLIKQRQIDEESNIKKPIEIQVKQSRQRIQMVLADKIRALFFIAKNIADDGELKQKIALQLGQCMQIKQKLMQYNDQEIKKIAPTIFNDYDWTICYQNKVAGKLDKKCVITQYQKYGPINSVEIRCITSDTEGGKNEEKNQSQYIVKINFLAVRSSWQFYQNGPNEMEVEGSQMKWLFSANKLNSKTSKDLEAILK